MTEEILIRVEGQVGRMTLNRPEALNALTQTMIDAMLPILNDWAVDKDISLVMIDAAGDRAFCAGGDISQLYSESRAGNLEFGRKFWRDEYKLNALIANYPKPYLAIMDGIVMGGGVGISAHGAPRIVTERTMFAMPECAIGLVPDVGGSLLLGRTPGRIGEYLGLTGARLSGADCIYAGLADHYVLADDLDAMKQAIVKSGDITTIERFKRVPPIADLDANLEAINAAFGHETLAQIIDAVQADQSNWGVATQKGLYRAAPLSAHVALRMIRESRENNTIEGALTAEYRFVSRAAEHSEFLEGIRAAIIDKDRNPQWRDADFSAVTAERIDQMFQPAEDGDLTL